MRWVSGILVVLTTALPGVAQIVPAKNKPPHYYPLKVGTKWTYEVDSGNAQKVQMLNQIAKIETIDGKAMARLETVVNGMVAGTEHLAGTPTGVFRHRASGVEVSPPICILKYPFKEGESWEAEPTIGPQQVKMTFRSGKNEEVTSPAGKFQTVSVATETSVNGVKIISTSWYAPDVGMINQITEVGDRKIKLQLVKFEAGK